MRCILTFILSCSVFLVYAQQPFIIKGRIINQEDHNPIGDVPLRILSDNDQLQAMTTDSGRFEVKVFNEKDYNLLIDYLGFQKRNILFSTSNSHIVDLGIIYLTPQYNSLNAVSVKGYRNTHTFSVNGDTLKIDAKALKTHENADLADLLKQIPTLSLNQDGSITERGRQIDIILINNRPYYLKDLKQTVTNLRADMVDSLEIYQPVATPGNHRPSGKIMNITLKKTARREVFGELEAAAGSDNRYEGKASLNAFMDSVRVGAHFGFGNTASANSNDLSNSGAYTGFGSPKNMSAGAHVDLARRRSTLALDYNYNKDDITGKTTQQSKHIVDNLNTQGYQGSIDFKNKAQKHNVTAAYSHTGKKLSLSLYADGSAGTKRNNTSVVDSTFSNEGIINASSQKYATESKEKTLNSMASLVYNINSQQSLSLSFGNNYSSDSSSSQLHNKADFYSLDAAGNNTIDSSLDHQFQRFTNISTNQVFGKLNYSVLLSQPVRLNVNAKLDQQKATSVVSNTNNTLQDQSGGSAKLNTFSKQLGAGLVYSQQGAQISADLTADMIRYDFNGHIRNFVYFSPYLNIHLNGESSDLDASYAGQPVAPSLQQLYPIPQTISPINVYLPSDSLNYSYSHMANVLYNLYSADKLNTYTAAATLNILQRPITYSTNIASNGVSEQRFVNSPKSNRLLSFSLSAARQLAPSWTGKATLSYNINKLYNLTNNSLAAMTSNAYMLSFNVRNYEADKRELSLMVRMAYNRSTSTITNTYNNNGLLLNINPTAKLFLPYKFMIQSTLDAIIQPSNTTFNQNLNRVLWNGSLSKFFLKDNSLSLNLSCFDILNDNKFFNRSAQNNVISQSITSTLSRYFLLSAVWQFK